MSIRFELQDANGAVQFYVRGQLRFLNFFELQLTLQVRESENFD